jgi:hypothetical protein
MATSIQRPCIKICGPIVGATLLIACSGGANQPASQFETSSATARPPSPSTSPSKIESPAASPFVFTSERYGYSVRLPSGWYLRDEGSGKWTIYAIGYAGAGTDSFEEEWEGRTAVRNFPGRTYGLYVSAAQLAEPTDVAAWTKDLAGTMRSGSSCQGSPALEAMTVAGEPAQALIYDRTDCTHDHHVVVVGVLHGRMGYDLMWLAKRGENDARRDQLMDILGTFRWTS